jgi:hypothetical protein
LVTLAARAEQARSDNWQFVGEGITSGISGVAIIESHAGQTEVLVARDNKMRTKTG